MKKIGIGIGVVLGVLLIAAAVLHFVGQNRLNQAPEVTVATVTVPSDAAAVERGRHLATISSCTECHGRNLEGTAFVDEAPIGYIPAPNLTAGGVGADYSDADWARAIRHGVARDGRVITTMPSDHYAEYGDDDLGTLIAYLKTVPAVEDEFGTRDVQFPGTIIFGLLAYDSWAVNKIDHAAVGGQNAPPVADTAEYGEYLVNIASCASCHGENLAGNTPDSDSPQGPNLTPGGDLGDWTLADFSQAMRGGVTPEGRQLSAEMPWAQYGVMSDTEVAALYAYLNTLPSLPDN